MLFRFALLVAELVALIALGSGPTSAQTAGELVYRKAMPSVVTITAGDRTGTGFLVRDKRTFITAAHVISNGEVPVVKFGKGSTLSVRSMAVSMTHDLAVLETEDEVSAEPLALGDRDEISPGAQVFAIGTALGALSHTLTDGMLSGIRTSGVTEVIQVTSPFSPGMSGGPVLSKDSKVLGVISFTFTEGQNLNIAVAAKQVRSLLAEPMRGTLVVAAELKRAAASEQPKQAKSSESTRPPSIGSAEAKAQAVADLLSEVMWWAQAAEQDAYRCSFDSMSMNDWRLVTESVDGARRRLPLLESKGVQNDFDISGRISRLCSASEFEQLSGKILSISKALGDMASRYGMAIIDRHGGVSTKEHQARSWASATDAANRASSLVQDLMTIAFAIGGEQAVAGRLGPKGYGFISVGLGIQYDPDRPEVAAVRWRYPSVNSAFRVGDVITGMRIPTAPEFVLIENWRDAARFLKQVKGDSEVVVRVRSGREFVVRYQ